MLPKYPSTVAGIRKFQKVEVESYNKELTLSPDCIGYSDEQLLWVEFKRSHEVDTDKATKIKCSYSLYLKEAAKALIKEKFVREKKFYIAPFDKFFDLKSLGYTECIKGSNIKDFEYDLVITRKGKISDDSIYILLDEKGNNNYSMPGNHYRTIIVPINEESIMLTNICYNGQLNAPGIKYFNFNPKVEKKEGKPTFTLYADGHYDYNKKSNNQPSSATYKIEFISKFDNERDAKEFAVLKCLEENRKVCPCIVCNNLTRHLEGEDECFIGKIGDISCKYFILYPFIRTRIYSKYKDAKVKAKSFLPGKERNLWDITDGQ